MLLSFPQVGNGQDDWNIFRGNPQLTGVASGNLPINLQLRWTFKAEDGIESTAAISGERFMWGLGMATCMPLTLKMES